MGEKEQGWLVGEFSVGIGNGSINGEPIVIYTIKAVGLDSPGTFVMMPESAREFALHLNAAVDELERNPNDPEG